MESNTPNDAQYKVINAALSGLERARDAVALRIKAELDLAAFRDVPVFGAQGQTAACQAIINAAGLLARHA